MSHYAQSFDDESEGEKCQEKDIEFLKAGEDTTESFEPAQEALNLIAFFVEGAT